MHGEGVLAESLSAMSTSVTSQSATEDDIDSGVIRDARSLMHLLGNLSTTTPGCGAIRDAELLPMLMATVEQTLGVMLPSSSTPCTRLNHTWITRAAPSRVLGNYKASRCCPSAASRDARRAGRPRRDMDESTERKRKIDSLSSLEDFETQATTTATTTATTLATTTASRNDAPKYEVSQASFDQGAMLTMAYTCFSTGGCARACPDSPMVR